MNVEEVLKEFLLISWSSLGWDQQTKIMSWSSLVNFNSKDSEAAHGKWNQKAIGKVKTAQDLLWRTRDWERCHFEINRERDWYWLLIQTSRIHTFILHAISNY